MSGRWVWLATLGPIGVGSLAYVIAVRGFLAPAGAHALTWPLIGVLPIFALGLWLLTVSSSRGAVHVALAGSGLMAASAYETFQGVFPSLATQWWFPIANMAGLTADAVGSVGFLLAVAGFPTGAPERPWQQRALKVSWVGLLSGPLSLLTSPYYTTPGFSPIPSGVVPNPYAVPALQWAAPAVESLLVNSLLPGILCLGVLLMRIVFGSPETRRMLRVFGGAVGFTAVAYSALYSWPDVFVFQVLVYLALAALPVAFIHGILRHGGYDLPTADGGRTVLRSSSLLMTVFYGVAVLAPGLLLGEGLHSVAIAVLTAALAVALLPVRGWLQRWVQRTVLGDRDRQFAMLTDLGAQLERASGPDALLTRLAEAVRGGLDASWVRIRLTDVDGVLAEVPHALVGVPTAGAALAADLRGPDGPVGRIELGARRRGAYSEAEQDVLRTVAAQASTAVANARLSAQLADRLRDLTESRERLVVVQDEERRRLERDLHDGVQQNVVALIASLRLARNRLARGTLADGELAELQDQARETLSDLRELAPGIHPPVLTDNGLVAAVESGVARFPVPLTVEADDDMRAARFPEEVETTAYYVVREALANTAKHAGAHRATVDLRRVDGHLRILVTDDGRGLASVTPSPRGGLANIRDRVAALNGTMQVGGYAASGTTVLVDLPLDRQELGHA